MKKMHYLFVVAMLSTPLVGLSQSNAEKVRSVSELKVLSVKDSYGLTYELVDPSLLTSDSLILDKIDAIFLDSFREESEDVTITHKHHGFSLLIYSREKCRANKVQVSRPLNK